MKGKLIGDPLDLKMFEGTNWIMKENQIKNDPLNNNVTIKNLNEINTDINNNINISNNNGEDNNNINEYDPLVLAYIRPQNEKDMNV